MSFSDLFPQLAAPETPRFPADPMFLLRFHQNDGAANVLSGSGTVPSSAPRTVLLPVAKPGTLVEIEVDGDPRVVVRGTPGAGQVGVSAITGAVTFHSSDAGEPFTWELDALHTVATADFLNRLQAEVKAAQDGTVLPAPLASIAGLTTAADQMIYTTAADTYAVTTLTAFARTLLDDADAATARGTLGLGTLAVENAASIGVDLVPSGTRNIGSATNPWNGGVYNGTVFTRYDSALTGTGRLEMVRVGTGSPTAHGLAWARDTQRFGFYTDIAAAVRADFEAKDLIAIGKNIVNPSAALSSASFPIFTAGNDTAAALLGAPVGGYWNHRLARFLLSLNNGSGATCDLGVADLFADNVNVGDAVLNNPSAGIIQTPDDLLIGAPAAANVRTGQIRIAADADNMIARFSVASNTAAQRPLLLFDRSRGTHASRASVADGDEIAGWNFAAWHPAGTPQFYTTALARVVVDGAVSGVAVPSRWDFQTSLALTRVTRFSLRADGRAQQNETTLDGWLSARGGDASTSRPTLALDHRHVTAHVVSINATAGATADNPIWNSPSLSAATKALKVLINGDTFWIELKPAT